MRKFKQRIFCGSGQLSNWKIGQLRDRLEEGITILSGLQQGGDPSICDKLEDVVRDIAAALLGQQITLGEEVELTPAMIREEEEALFKAHSLPETIQDRQHSWFVGLDIGPIWLIKASNSVEAVTIWVSRHAPSYRGRVWCRCAAITDMREFEVEEKPRIHIVKDFDAYGHWEHL